MPAGPGHPAREDHEYRWEGTCNLFLHIEPLRGWRHVAVTTPVATVFQIAVGRSQATRQAFIGPQPAGIIHSDRAHASGDIPIRQRQLCWAHLVRNWQGLVDQQHTDSPVAQAGLAWAGQVFQVWAAQRAGLFDLLAVQYARIPVRHALRAERNRGARSAWSSLRDMSRMLLKHWDALWTFTVEPGGEPTNNRAEQAIRPAVLWRKSCFGTQRAAGSHYVERMLSLIATCRQQDRPLFATLLEILTAAGRVGPHRVSYRSPERLRQARLS